MEEGIVSFQGSKKIVVFCKCGRKRRAVCISKEVNPYLASSFLIF